MSQATARVVCASTYPNPINCLVATSFLQTLSAVGIFQGEVAIFFSVASMKRFSPFPKKPLFIRVTAPQQLSVAKKL